MAKDIIVVGGGIVGVCSALLLQRAGHKVRLIDAKKPGRETSYGNAGVFAEDVSRPGFFASISLTGKHPMAMPVCLPRHHLWC